MGQRRHHYEAAFEAYLREKRLPYVSVNEARKALLPRGAKPELEGVSSAPGGISGGGSLKSFDFVVYAAGMGVLVEVKGRKLGTAKDGLRGVSRRLESWVTLEDVRSMGVWQGLFGEGFEAAFLFLYWCEAQPADGLFEEVFDHQGRWYALRVIRVSDYASAMTTRSERWGTVQCPQGAFGELSTTLERFLALQVG